VGTLIAQNIALCMIQKSDIPGVHSSRTAAICADESTIAILPTLVPDLAMLEAAAAAAAADAAVASQAQRLWETDRATPFSSYQHMPVPVVTAALPIQKL
jgi:hypothetical protein